MFWRKRHSQKEVVAKIVAIILNIEKHAKPGTAVRLVKRLVTTRPDVDMSDVVFPPQDLVLPFEINPQQPLSSLTAALQCKRDEATKLALVEVLLNAGAVAQWTTPWQLSSYGRAILQRDYKVASLLLHHSLLQQPEGTPGWKGLLSSAIAVVFRAVLAADLPLPPPESSESELEGSSDSSGNASEAENGTFLSDFEEGDDAVDNYDDDASRIWTPIFDDVAWLLSRCHKDSLPNIHPWGAPSITHCALESFAELIEEQAKLKTQQRAYLGTLTEVEQQAFVEIKFTHWRLTALNYLLKRVWALLHISLEAGAPAIRAETSKFPSAPQNSKVDHTLIWHGLKQFATAWPAGQWTVDSHSLYHPNFKQAVQTILMISRTRGFPGTTDNVARSNSSGECKKQEKYYYLDMNVVEKIVGFMGASGQSSWMPVA